MFPIISLYFWCGCHHGHSPILRFGFLCTSVHVLIHHDRAYHGMLMLYDSTIRNDLWWKLAQKYFVSVLFHLFDICSFYFFSTFLVLVRPWNRCLWSAMLYIVYEPLLLFLLSLYIFFIWWNRMAKPQQSMDLWLWLCTEAYIWQTKETQNDGTTGS